MIIALPVAILIVGALFTLALKKNWIGISAIIASLASLVFVTLFIGTKVYAFSGWKPPYGIAWVLDDFSIFVSILVTSIAVLIAIYSIRYVRKRSHRYYALLCLITAGMIGISLTGDIFNMYVFFEIMSIASYSLVAFFDDKHSLEGAFKYLVMGSFASSFILTGIALLYGLSGTLNIAHIASIIDISGLSPVYLLSIGMIIGGLCLKAAIVPFHFWKPDAIEGTPAPVGALFTATSSAIGLYLIMRILFIFGMIEFNLILIILGVLTMFLGVLLALYQKNIKRVLAYSSISQTGYIATAFGLGTLAGVTAGAYQILNNAIIETLIFMTFGVAMHVLHKENFGELSIKNDFLMASSLISILALIGIPLTNGFASKWLIYMATWEVSPLLTILTLVITGFTAAYSLKILSGVFLAPNKKEIDVPLSMKIPIVILVVLVVVIGIFPQFGMNIAENAAKSFFDISGYMHLVLG